MAVHYFKGTALLTAFVFRQQRFSILVWLIALISITMSVASAYHNIYEDEQARQAVSLTMENPVMLAMLGPGYEAQQYVHSIGAIFANEMLLFTAIAVAIMSILLVGRATRGDEEDGRIEMIRALSVGRLSYASAVMLVIVSVHIVLALLTAIGLVLLGLEGVNMEGALLYGSLLGVTGLLFTAITAVFAQLAETARGTTMFSLLLLITAYFIRAIGDVSNAALSWISPLGWTVRSGVFVDNNWWPVILSLAVAILLGLVAFYLHAIRDLGAGFIEARKGKANASPLLQTSFGLALRLQRTTIIAWMIGLFVLSSSFGAILGDLELYFADLELMQAFIQVESDYTMTEQFIALLMAIMSLISLVPAVMVVLKLKGEEVKNLTEIYYTRAVSRTHVLGNHVLLALAVSVLMQSLIALGLWSAGKVAMEEAISFGRTFASAYVYLPAIWIIIGLVIGLIGLVPKFTGSAWLYIVYCFIVVYLGDLLDFPEWMHHLSVFKYIPQFPADDMSITAVIVLLLLALVLSVIGFVSYNRRDQRAT